MTRAVRIDQNGGPEVLKIVDVTVGDPGPGEIRIRHKAVGLNFIDVYQRTGLYPLPMPLNLGMEASGVVEAVGPGVTHLQVGDRAAYASQPPGSYCEVRVMPAKVVCKLPDAIDFDTGAAMMLKGMTAQFLLKRTLPQGGLQAGDFVLFHAAAGGVGLIACQWAKALGYQLIGTAGSDAKCQACLALGADHAINYRTHDFAQEAKRLTGGVGVNVILDMVAGDYIAREVECLAEDGRLVIIAVQGGIKSEFNAGLVLRRRLQITGSTLRPRPVAFKSAIAQSLRQHVWPLIAAGKIKPVIHSTFAAANATDAHVLMESNQHIGKIVLTW